MLASPAMDTALPPASANWLPYIERLQARPLAAIDLVVVHCTELPDLASAREYGERELYASGTGNSGQFYTDGRARKEKYVPLQRMARRVRGSTPGSADVGLVNGGRWPNWCESRRRGVEGPYPPAQVAALLALLQALSATLPGLAWIAGHDGLDTDQVPASDDPSLRVARKRDPGPRFPWPQVLAGCTLAPLPAGH